jgi:hypothetical protein
MSGLIEFETRTRDDRKLPWLAYDRKRRRRANARESTSAFENATFRGCDETSNRAKIRTVANATFMEGLKERFE